MLRVKKDKVEINPRVKGKMVIFQIKDSKVIKQEEDMLVRPEKFQFLEKGQNRNFGYKIVISVKNLKFILWMSDDETDFTVGIV